jgi:general secretion pathway protein J
MRRADPCSSVSGFSLIEALAALALTATIIVALGSVAGQWLPNWRRGFVELQRTDLLGLGLERITEDVAAAEYVTPWGGAQAPLFEGDTSSAIFVRSAIGPDSYPHLEVVRLAQVKDDRGLALIRTRAPFTPTAPGVSHRFPFGDPVVLIRTPFRISFAYAGADRVWVDGWNGRERLPDAVRITVRDTIANRILAASTAFRVQVTAQGPPKHEEQASPAEAAQSAAGAGAQSAAGAGAQSAAGAGGQSATQQTEQQ